MRKAVREIKNGKSCGPEGVYAEMLKHRTDKLTKMLTRLINRCLNWEEAPQQWKVAYISSIHKKGSKKDCSKYRGTSVTTVMSRLYSKIIRDLIEKRIKMKKNKVDFEQEVHVQTTSLAWNSYWKKECNKPRNPFIICGFGKSAWQYTDIKTLGSFERIKY